MPKRYFLKTRKTRKHRKRGGGEDYDIEQGPVIPVVPLKRIPTDPVKRQEEIGRNITRTISPAEAELVFSGPNPEEKQRLERLEMSRYDRDRDVDAYTSSEMSLFSEGGRKKSRKHRRKTRRTRRKTKKHHKK